MNEDIKNLQTGLAQIREWVETYGGETSFQVQTESPLEQRHRVIFVSLRGMPSKPLLEMIDASNKWEGWKFVGHSLKFEFSDPTV